MLIIFLIRAKRFYGIQDKTKVIDRLLSPSNNQGHYPDEIKVAANEDDTGFI